MIGSDEIQKKIAHCFLSDRRASGYAVCFHRERYRGLSDWLGSDASRFNFLDVR